MMETGHGPRSRGVLQFLYTVRLNHICRIMRKNVLLVKIIGHFIMLITFMQTAVCIIYQRNLT